MKPADKAEPTAKPVEKTPVAANDAGQAKPQSRNKAKRAPKAKPSSADA